MRLLSAWLVAFAWFIGVLEIYAANLDLGDHDVSFFEQHGYLGPRMLLSPADCDELKQERFRLHDRAVLKTAWLESPSLARVASTPQLVGYVKRRMWYGI
jgi:hypothetical protein